VLDKPNPQPSPGGVVVEVRAALTCGTDVKAFQRGHPKIPLPSPMGHEYSGVIAACGDQVRNFQVGDAVMGVHSAPCGRCFYCGKGLFNLCETIMDTKVMGAFAERLALPEAIVRQNLFPMPAGLSHESAAFLEPLACVMHGMHVSRAAETTDVVIFGAGPIGLLFLLALRRHGCRVVVVEPQPGRRETALRLGAEAALPADEHTREAVMECTGGHGVDLAVECTGRTDVWAASVDYVRRGGAVLLFGGTPPDTQVCFDTARLHYDQISVLGCFHFRPADVRAAADLLATGELDPSPLISGETDLDGLPDIMGRLAAGDGIKYVVRP